MHAGLELPPGTDDLGKGGGVLGGDARSVVEVVPEASVRRATVDVLAATGERGVKHGDVLILVVVVGAQASSPW